MPDAPLPEVILYTDGACSGNPGPGGWAALLRWNDREVTLSGREDATTNNRMELRAVVEGLRRLEHPCRVAVHTDSAYVANALNQGWLARWKRNGWRTAAGHAVLNRDLWEELDRQMARHDVRFVKVKGHADDALNVRVDRLAVAALRGGDGAARRPSA